MIEHTVDRTGWPPGPWDGEPEDRIEWAHAGIPCVMNRDRFDGAWRGYVFVPPGHPWHGVSGIYIDSPGHAAGDVGMEPRGIIDHPEAPEGSWALGFDCAHIWDLTPTRPSGDPFREYRDRDYVRGEVEALARAAAAGGAR